MSVFLRSFAVAAALAPVLLPGTALADARDDVVAGMMRCAVIADDRQWLECYYGAAQPMRGRLGLPPAPQSQQQLLQQHYSGAPVHPVNPAMAAPLAPLGAPPPAYYPPQQQMASRAPVPSGPPPMPKQRGVFSDFFGGSNLVHNQRVQSYEIAKDGSFTVTLDDGQVWQQTADDAGRHPARWREPAQTMRVTVSEGAMRSFNMTVNDNDSVQYKVRRVR
jgi:hypothetical protein